MRVSLHIASPTSRTVRARQVETLFDVPPEELAKLHWEGEVPLDAREWNVGLIVGPSGSGKTQVAKRIFGDAYHPTLDYSAPSVLDDVRESVAVQDIASAFSSVGFNTIPAWLRPFAVLSNGEQFRADLARRLLELPDPVVVDEFSSVVDRQVAQIASFAVQKFVRARARRFVAISCHLDVLDWLQPDWVLEPTGMRFAWRSLQRRPAVDLTIARVAYEAWRVFAPFHYLTASLHRAARCFCAFVGDRPVAFVGTIHAVHATTRNLKRVSRVVTLPDWQGIGIAFVLLEAVGAALRACKMRLRTYPAHLALVRAFNKSPRWSLVKKFGEILGRTGKTSARPDAHKSRMCATFEYVGPAHPDPEEARRFLDGEVAHESPV